MMSPRSRAKPPAEFGDREVALAGVAINGHVDGINRVLHSGRLNIHGAEGRPVPEIRTIDCRYHIAGSQERLREFVGARDQTRPHVTELRFQDYSIL